MDEMSKIPEEQNNEELVEQQNPEAQTEEVIEPVAEIPTPKAPRPKLPFIIGGTVAGVAAIAIAVAVILGGGSNSGDGSNNPSVPHEHNFSAWNVVDEPTCLVAGVEERVCGCDEKETRPIAALGHTEVVDSAVPATCKNTGLTEGKHCSSCGTVITAQETIPMTAHTYDDKYDEDCNVCGYEREAECAHAETEVVPGKTATCTATGLTDGEKCKKCGETIILQSTIPMVAHTYDNKYDDECNICGHKRDAECAHTETEVIPGKSATCTATGLTDGAKCKKCGETLVSQTAIPVKAHTEVIDVAVEATCTSKGLTEGKHCSVCSKVIVAQNVTNMKLHTEVVDSAVSATCTSTGLTEGKHCSVCSTVLLAQTTVPMKPHTEVITPAFEPTCISVGATEGKYCSVCSKVLVPQTEIPMKPHTEVVDVGVEATCTNGGLTDGKHCSVCGTTIVAHERIPALGHIEVIDAAVPATCTTNGKTEGKHCSRCYETLVDQTTVSALGHVEVTDAAVAPTCTTTGLTEGKHCSRCSAILVSQTVVGIRHTEGSWIIDVEATCTEPGSKHQVCALCVATIKTETIAAKGHDYSGEYISGDCNSPDQMILNCGVCGDNQIENVSPISATIYRSGYTSINGYIYSVSYAVLATGGYGQLQYKYEVLSSATNSTVILTEDYCNETSFGFKSEFSLNNRVLRVTIKDDYGNKTKYEILVEDSSFLVNGEIYNQKTHSYTSHVTVPSTALKEGVRTYTCSVCDYSYTEVIPATGIVIAPGDTTGPELVSVTLDKTEVTVGDIIIITAEIQDESSIKYAQFNFQLGGDLQLVILEQIEGNIYKGELKITNSFANGIYDLSYIFIQDYAGNSSHPSDDASFTVTNEDSTIVIAPGDTTGPELVSVTLDKAEVTVGDIIIITAEIQDESSIKYAQFNFQLGGDLQLVILEQIEGNIYKGELKITNSFANGIYDLSYIFIQDYAGNSSHPSSDVSFTVVK